MAFFCCCAAPTSTSSIFRAGGWQRRARLHNRTAAVCYWRFRRPEMGKPEQQGRYNYLPSIICVLLTHGCTTSLFSYCLLLSPAHHHRKFGFFFAARWIRRQRRRQWNWVELVNKASEVIHVTDINDVSLRELFAIMLAKLREWQFQLHFVVIYNRVYENLYGKRLISLNHLQYNS